MGNVSRFSCPGHRQRQVLHDLTSLVEAVDPDDFKGHARKKKGAEKAHVGCQHEPVKVEGITVDNSVPPPRIQEPPPVGLTIPLLLRDQMGSFPATMRIPSLQATLRLILSIYLDKLLYDRNCDDNARPRLVVGAFQGRKRVIQRRFNVGVLEATPERKASTLLVRPER